MIYIYMNEAGQPTNSSSSWEVVLARFCYQQYLQSGAFSTQRVTCRTQKKGMWLAYDGNVLLVVLRLLVRSKRISANLSVSYFTPLAST